MPNITLIADSGATKTEWCILENKKTKTIFTHGLSPYFLSREQISDIVFKEIKPVFGKKTPGQIYFYGTGCKSIGNKRLVRNAIREVFSKSEIHVFDDLTGAARSLCLQGRGIACIIGTGSNSCYYNGTKIVKNSPGLGFILGDEGSGAVFGKSLVQHYLYDLMDTDLKNKFEKRFHQTRDEILDYVYRKPTPNRYLAAFAIFLSENRGNYMIENIIVDGLNQFFYTHLLRYKEIQKYPVHFTGSVAYGFRDIIISLCKDYEMTLGNIYKAPMEGLIKFHS